MEKFLRKMTILFYLKKISKLIVDKKLYLESDFSLSKLGKLIGQSTQKTSSVINQYAKQNFNDFINYYRIQDAKTLLVNNESEKFTISSIAFDSGFNSLFRQTNDGSFLVSAAAFV
jgi:AraC-like DNA-binding protein